MENKRNSTNGDNEEDDAIFVNLLLILNLKEQEKGAGKWLRN